MQIDSGLRLGTAFSEREGQTEVQNRASAAAAAFTEGFRVLGFGVLAFRVWGLGFKVEGFGLGLFFFAFRFRIVGFGMIGLSDFVQGVLSGDANV